MGLPGSGKTTLASALKTYLEENGVVSEEKLKSIALDEPIFLDKVVDRISVKWFNADEVRQKYNDWDFSQIGRAHV